MRGTWPMTVGVSPSSNRTCGFPASGSRRLFTGLLHELCHFSACSWLAGRAFAAISELPLPSPAPWVFLSLAGHHPVLCLLGTHQHNCPAFAPPRFPGFPCYYAGLRLLPAPFRPPPFLGLRRTLRLSPHPSRSPGLSRLPFPTCHLRRHRQSDRQTPTVVRSAPDRLRRTGIGSSPWL